MLFCKSFVGSLFLIASFSSYRSFATKRNKPPTQRRRENQPFEDKFHYKGVSVQDYENADQASASPGREVAAVHWIRSRFRFVIERIAPETKVKLRHYTRCGLAVNNIVDIAEIEVFPAWRNLLLHWPHGLNVICLMLDLHGLRCCCVLCVCGWL